MICLSAQQGEAGKCFRTCKTDTDCGQGYTCFNTGSVSVCKAVAGGGSTGGEGADGSGIGKQCKDGRDCGDLICMGGTSKICTKTCNLNSSEDCPENHVCLKTSTSSNGFCWPKDKSGAPKPFGSSCSDSSGCLSGYCVGGYCSDTCATDSECPIGFKKCSDSGDGTKVCTIFGEGKKAFGSTCSTDGDCQSAYCTEGLCVEICDANINCPSGYTCDSTAKTCMAQLSWSSTKDNGCSCTLMDLNRTSSGSNFNIVFFLILIATSLWGFRMRIHLG